MENKLDLLVDEIDEILSMRVYRNPVVSVEDAKNEVAKLIAVYTMNCEHDSVLSKENYDYIGEYFYNQMLKEQERRPLTLAERKFGESLEGMAEDFLLKSAYKDIDEEL